MCSYGFCSIYMVQKGVAMDTTSLAELRITRFLATHFGEELGWTFEGERTGKVSADEFFGSSNFLPAFVHIANRMAARYGVGCLDIKVVNEPAALLGMEARVVSVDGFRSATLLLLIEAVEHLCGEALHGRTIDPSVVYDYLLANPKDRDSEYDPCLDN